MKTETPTDKTGAATTVTEQPGRFTIEVEGRTVGLADYHDREGRRVFPHTEVPRVPRPRSGNDSRRRSTALHACCGARIVPICSMVADYIDKHPEYADITDPV